MKKPITVRSYWGSLCWQISVVLAACLPLLIPFEAGRTIDLQGGVLVVAGTFAWLALLLNHRQFKNLESWQYGLLGVFFLFCLISSLVNPHFGYNLWGAPYLRIGSAGLLAFLGIGLLLRNVGRQQLARSLYLIILILSLISPIYTYLHFHSLQRMGGVFMQADVMACVLGVGWLLGLGMLTYYPKYRVKIAAGQLVLIVSLLLTQTRAVLLLVVVLTLIYLWQGQPNKLAKHLLVYLGIAGLFIGGLYMFGPSRLTNSSYAYFSVNYRLNLQATAVSSLGHRLLLGYGPGNLADALTCSKLSTPSLQTTCNQGYFFNSSHNIFLDRSLQVGLVGGLSFLAFVVVSLVKGSMSNQRHSVLVYSVLLIACYYLTNVTSIGLELLFWILLFSSVQVNKSL